ncbi:MAG: Na/Pi cotransporter family protein [Spirochaetaceae bacterium]|nr:Na/Pi cotransporter family protein [Spirochaetaceae bacterium]
MNLVVMIIQLIGNLGFLLYGMKLMSDGIQKSTGEKLQRALSVITENRFMGLITGLLITMIIQSSGATTVMVVTFVNAGMMTLTQSASVIFGANIGTTITAWIVSIFGFNFNISDFAIPVFGFGFFLAKLIKKSGFKGVGDTLMGFGLLFFGLSGLSSLFSPDQMGWLFTFGDHGILSLIIGFFVGIAITAILHSSSAFSAIVITMAYNGLVSWELAAAMTLGSNIGSTIDAVLASLGSSSDAKRAAFIHVFFNIAGTLFAILFFKQFLKLVVFLTPGGAESNIAIRISMMHTVFKVLSTALMLPFVKQIVKLSKKVLKDKPGDEQKVFHMDFTESSFGKDNIAAHIIRAEKAIKDMADHVTAMFDHIQLGFMKRDISFEEEHLEQLVGEEDFADQMHEQITRYILHIERLPVTDKQLDNLSIMIQVVDDLESMSDDCLSIGMLIKKSVDKNMTFEESDMERLVPYLELVRQFLQFIHININKHLNADKLSMAQELEDQIDAYRKNLKKVARKRLEKGADVKSELLYIDFVRNIEKIGDRAFSISEALSQTH